jgi:FkbM family methyltransferase
MSRAARAIGLARSLLVYHGIPGRQRRLRRLYVRFVRSGDLAFDIGAHAGNRVRALLALGCRVVAVEPQPDFARLLDTLFGARRRDVHVVRAAVGADTGRAWLETSDRDPTLATTRPAWRAARQAEPGFAHVRWNRRLEVDLVTLDWLIARFGQPAFVKIDVEGAEAAALAGLSRPVPALSFEYLPGALDEVAACVVRLEALGPYRFNWSVGETHRLSSPTWVSGTALLDGLTTPAARRRSGDVYAALDPR